MKTLLNNKEYKCKYLHWRYDDTPKAPALVK